MNFKREQLKAMLDWLDLYGVDEIELKGDAQEVLDNIFSDPESIVVQEEPRGKSCFPTSSTQKKGTKH